MKKLIRALLLFTLLHVPSAHGNDPLDGARIVDLVPENYRGQQHAIARYLKERNPELQNDPEITLEDVEPEGRQRTLRSLYQGWFDIDGDGFDEMFLLDALYLCGSIGCPVHVLKVTPQGLLRITEFAASLEIYFPTKPFRILTQGETSCRSTELVPRTTPPYTVTGGADRVALGGRQVDLFRTAPRSCLQQGRRCGG